MTLQPQVWMTLAVRICRQQFIQDLGSTLYTDESEYLVKYTLPRVEGIRYNKNTYSKILEQVRDAHYLSFLRTPDSENNYRKQITAETAQLVKLLLNKLVVWIE